MLRDLVDSYTSYTRRDLIIASSTNRNDTRTTASQIRGAHVIFRFDVLQLMLHEVWHNGQALVQPTTGHRYPVANNLTMNGEKMYEHDMGYWGTLIADKLGCEQHG